MFEKHRATQGSIWHWVHCLCPSARGCAELTVRNCVLQSSCTWPTTDLMPQAHAYACHCAQVHCTTEAGGRQVPPLLPQFRSEVDAELPDSATIPPLETPGVSAVPLCRQHLHVNTPRCASHSSRLHHDIASKLMIDVCSSLFCSR